MNSKNPSKRRDLKVLVA